jgi:hypothetical protein
VIPWLIIHIKAITTVIGIVSTRESIRGLYKCNDKFGATGATVVLLTADGILGLLDEWIASIA